MLGAVFNLFFVNGEMWQRRYPAKAWGQSFEDGWRRLAPYEEVRRARIIHVSAAEADARGRAWP